MAAILGFGAMKSVSTAEPSISYNFEVRPLLASKCFACHGADAAKRKGKLRLDDGAVALEKKAVVPGDPAASLLLERISSTDEDEVMPPPEKHDPLSDAEKNLLRRWIAQGAKYEKHWAFIPPVKPVTPVVAGVSHPIDAIVGDVLAKKGWLPAPEADREQWLRRVSLALTGLPPSIQDIDGFLADTSAEAYERVVDRLLKSPHYGERMAIIWLDAARYGDTYGRHEDADSEVWPWRDWVIRAFNENLPYDKFIQWQMAGDMLPNATQDQVVATAFHRLPVQSNESGSDPDEFRWDQVFDRVKTTSTAVLGLTLECSRCHDHKYDPITRRDYYQLAAFLNNIDELGLFSRFTNGIPTPTTFVYKEDQQAQHQKLKLAVEQAESEWNSARKQAAGRYAGWLKGNQPPGTGSGLWASLSGLGQVPRKPALPREPELYESFDLVDLKQRAFLIDSDPSVATVGTIKTSEDLTGKFGKACVFPKDKPKKYGVPKLAHYLRWQPFSFSLWFRCGKVPEKGVILHRSRGGLDAANRGYEITFESGKLTATLGHFYPGNAIRVQATDDLDFKEWRQIGFTYDGSSRAAGMKLFVDGKELPVKIIRDHLYKDIDYLAEWGDLDSVKVADATAKEAIMLQIGGRNLDSGIRDAAMDELRAYDAELSTAEMALLGGAEAKEDNPGWIDWYAREIDVPAKNALQKLTLARKEESDFSTHLTEMMVMSEMKGPRRNTPMLVRGDFRQPGECVQPGTPAALLPFPKDAPLDRRGLAQWMTDPQNPLTSRVEVNRIWAMLFGRGLVATQEDFGVQGRVPSDPALLDWLAVHFVESGWDIKALCREIVLSKTYRQSSLPFDPKTRKDDPDNLLLASGPRFRLPAEQLRDAALAASGLINPAVGGRSVKPYQPAGLWEDSGTQHVYEQDTGDKLYRRSLYTFWRRTCPPPTMSVFDAPTREFCLVRRESTLTPLQALALMDDTGFLESARVLAEKLVRQHPQMAEQNDRVEDAFRLLTARVPTEVQKKAMSTLINEARDHYTKNPKDAATLLSSTGASKADESLSAVEVASTMLMTRALLSSDAFVSSY